MASLTIRKLDEAVKAYLRLRSAGNGRSVEEEVRVILGELSQGRPQFPASPSSATSLPRGPAPRPRSFNGPLRQRRPRRCAAHWIIFIIILNYYVTLLSVV